MATYAKNTDVSVSKSRDEIEIILKRFGCGGFAYGSVGDNVRIEFTFTPSDRRRDGTKTGSVINADIKNGNDYMTLRLRFDMKLPPRGDFTHYKLGSVMKTRTDVATDKLHEQACRER